MTRELVDASAYTAAADALRRSDDVFDDAAEAAELRIADAVADRVRTGARRHSSRTAGQVRVTRKGAGVDRVTTVDVGGPIAHLIVGGADAHRIRPRRSLAMHVGPGRRFADAVRHPGFRGDPFVEEAIDAAGPEVAAVLDDVGADVVDELARRMERKR